MTRIFLSLMLICAALQQTPASRANDADKMLQAMVAGDFALVVSKFDDTMKKALTEDALRTGWSSIGQQFGPFKQKGTPREEARGPFKAVVIPCEFERGKLEVTMVFDSTGAIAGLSMRPPTPPWAPPPYADPAKYTERTVTVGSGDWALPGTLTLPAGAGPFPAVVLVHGSGPNDRDESIGANKPFKDLALGLASQGIAVLRYDKRTMVYPLNVSLQKAFTVKEETIDDALAAVALLRTVPAVDKSKIFVLGHSLGGMMVPRIAAADPKLAGIIAMAGAARPLDRAILEQYEYLFGADGVVTDAEQKEIDNAKQNIAEIAKLTPADAATGRKIGGAPASYWLDLRDYDPPTAAAKLSQRILVLQGERDYQVTVAEFDRWKAMLESRPNATLRLYPALNHLFLPGTGKSLPTEYLIPGHIPIEVIQDIAEWMKKTTGTTGTAGTNGN